jgi:Glycosyltransferase family 92
VGPGAKGSSSSRRMAAVGIVVVSFVLAYLGVGLFVSKKTPSLPTADTTTRQEVASKDTVRRDQEQPEETVRQDGESKTLTEDEERTKRWTDQLSNKDNPLRKFHLESDFGVGVEPDKVAPIADDKTSLHSKWNKPPPATVEEHPTPNNVLTAYIEQLDLEEWDVQPLPIRSKAKASLLKKVVYPAVHACTTLPKYFPVDNTPADLDPFLPWIHDVFPTADGKFIQIVAQNKRRCKTGRTETDILEFMQPQVAMIQHVPVKRLKSPTSKETRYQLTDYSTADPDGLTTRFICRFKPSMQETLSVFNFDYDWTAYRKRYKQTVVKDDGNIKSIHTSQIVFRCPVPDNLQEIVRTGASVTETDWATLFLDIVPIRTPPRYGPTQQYLQPKFQEFASADKSELFNATAAYGNDHILPRIQDSGRWENLPICKPSLMQYANQPKEDLPASISAPIPKKHRLVSCLWVSAGYTTRGERFAVNDGQRRLLEWMIYNQQIGFDHFYIYDNSGAFSNETSVKPIVDMFPGKVTYIEWPSAVCNNRPNNVDSPGERSSQYAAESSCLLRFGPHVEWIGQFDIDEYLVPMGEHNSALTILDKLEAEDKRIIAFGSWRAWPRWNMIE